jgi:hypothetical protein
MLAAVIGSAVADHRRLRGERERERRARASKDEERARASALRKKEYDRAQAEIARQRRRGGQERTRVERPKVSEPMQSYKNCKAHFFRGSLL